MRLPGCSGHHADRNSSPGGLEWNLERSSYAGPVEVQPSSKSLQVFKKLPQPQRSSPHDTLSLEVRLVCFSKLHKPHDSPEHPILGDSWQATQRFVQELIEQTKRLLADIPDPSCRETGASETQKTI